MNGFHAYFLSLTALLGVFSACEKSAGGPVSDTEPVPVQLALSVGTSGSSLTKGNPGIITEMSDDVTFRGMTGVTVLPFNVKRPIEASDESYSHSTALGDISQFIYDRAVGAGGVYVEGLIGNNWAHLYPSGAVSFPKGTASVLAYGSAPLAEEETEIRSRHLNGALEISGLGPQGVLAGDIHFNPVPIRPEALPSEAQQLADLLNGIFAPEVRYSADFWYEDDTRHDETMTLAWDDAVDDNTLRDCFLEITNGGNMIPGSGQSVEYMIARLYRRLKTYVSSDDSPVEYVHGGETYPTRKPGGAPLTWGDLYNGLRGLLIGRIEALVANGLSIDTETNNVELPSALRNYPASLGLPDGAAILRWNGNRFYPVEDTDGSSADGVAPVSSYCYPPRLWYYANTTISTSGSDRSESYTSDKAHWTDILDDYHFGKIVSGSTHSVALDQPLHFGNGMLIADVLAASSVLDDGDGDPVTRVHLEDDSFQVTGVIVGSQQQLNFDFTPAGGRSYFLYDNCISSLYLQTETAGEFRTLVSCTPAGEDVYLCLELQNNSGQSFVGADGFVLPGSKFYLVGRIDLGQGQASVFQPDCATTVHCRVSSLAEARNAIPNLEHPHIALGIQISVNWVMSTPSHVILS